MLPQDFVHYDKIFTNQNIISRHIKEVQALSSNPTNLETEYSKLRHKHTAESNTLHYYKKLYEKNKTNKADTLNGYYKLCNTNVQCNEMFEGSIFVLSAENQLNTICIKRFEDLEYFYEFLRYAPQPFIFLPFGDIYECRKLTKEMNLMSNNKSGIYVAEDDKQIVMVVEPFVLVKLDLEYLIEEFVNDQNICYFLYGFIVNKSDL